MKVPLILLSTPAQNKFEVFFFFLRGAGTFFLVLGPTSLRRMNDVACPDTPSSPPASWGKSQLHGWCGTSLAAPRNLGHAWSQETTASSQNQAGGNGVPQTREEAAER